MVRGPSAGELPSRQEVRHEGIPELVSRRARWPARSPVSRSRGGHARATLPGGSERAHRDAAQVKASGRDDIGQGPVRVRQPVELSHRSIWLSRPRLS
jgi:hypothetical protein